MKNLYISDLMVDFSLDELGIRLEQPPVSADRVLDILQARGVLTKPPVRRKRRCSRLVVRLAIAAALALCLSVTAWAVYQAMMEDYLVQTPTQLDAVIEDLGGETGPGATLSLVGYQGTPEYEAYTEWEAWQAEHYGEHPSDNSNWHETPDNYYELYGAAWQDQADALDQITDKYGVRLHESRAFADAGQIYELLGAAPFLTDEYDGASGYIYNDGTFKLDFSSDHDGVWDINSLFVSVKGTITNIAGTMGPGEYEEWSYQTASGPTVDLVLTSKNGQILYETGSAYVHVNATRLDQTQMGAGVPHMRESLEALADSVDFTELAKVFGEGASFDLTDAVEELDAAYWQEAQEDEESWEREQEEKYNTSLKVVETLGSYELVPPPDGYEKGTFTWGGIDKTVTVYGTRYDGSRTCWGTTVNKDSVCVSYGNAAGEVLELIYTRYYTGEDRAVSATTEQFDAAKAYYAAFEGFQERQVNGCPSFYYPEIHGEDGTIYAPGVMWLDEANDLVFVLDMLDATYFDVQTKETIFLGDPFEPDELIALAATVTEE